MAIVEMEFLKSAFATTVGAVVRAYAAVPFATLPAIGAERLVSSVEWQGDPVHETDTAGLPVAPGMLLFRIAVKIAHVSIAELRVSQQAAGAVTEGQAWIRVAPDAQMLEARLIAFAVNGAPRAALPGVIPLGSVPVISPAGLLVVRLAVVANDELVVLRFATSLSDDVLGPPVGRMTAWINGPEGGGGSNWHLQLPSSIFVNMVASRLAESMTQLPSNAVLEEAVRTTWQPMSGTWGVHATFTIEVINACPGLFSGTDLSVDVTIDASFKVSPAMDSIEITLHISTDASDWDSFRCWLGGAGLASLSSALVSPLLPLPASLASLVHVGEEIRQSIGDMTTSLDLGGFALVSETGDNLAYSGTIPLDPIPLSTTTSAGFRNDGLAMTGRIVPLPVQHKVAFNPDGGALSGDWARKINCSIRTMDEKFQFQAVHVTDNIAFANQDLGKVSVKPYLTSIAEPAGKCWIKSADAARDLFVNIDGPGMVTGDLGFAVIHCSAGLRAYNLGPVPGHQAMPLDTTTLIAEFCDSFHVPRRIVEVQELRWIEPPPDYTWGHAPIQQWQIVFDGLADAARIEIRSADGTLVASHPDLVYADGRAAIELVTDGRTSMIMRASGFGENVRYSTSTRWLLPIDRMRAPRDASALASMRGQLHVQAGDRWFRFDSRRRSTRPILTPDRFSRRSSKPGRLSAKLKDGLVALLHNGEIVIARPARQERYRFD